jgi:DNA-binding beta-propeller fold protein YncE
MAVRKKFITASILILVSAAVGVAVGLARFQPASTLAEAEPIVELGNPIRIAMGNNGTIFVSDHAKRQIVMYKKGDLASASAFAIPGRPLGIAVSGGSVYVGNSLTRRVEIYNKSGKLQGILGGDAGDILRPSSIAIDENLIFVLDSKAKVVKIFDVSADPSGTLVGTIPPEGPNSSMLTAPTCIAVDSVNKEVLVSDYGSSGFGGGAKVQIFDYQGGLVDTISGESGGWFKKETLFKRPQGLAVDGQGHIFLVASLLGRVIVMNRSDGLEVAALGTYGMEPGELTLPMDVLIDPDSADVFVTNSRAQRIELFEKGAILP